MLRITLKEVAKFQFVTKLERGYNIRNHIR